MNAYKNCTSVELNNTSILLEGVLTPYGQAECVYLGPGGIYVVLFDTEKPAAVYEHFRNLLGAARVRLYVAGKGEYMPSSDTFAGEFENDELDIAIYEYIHNSPQQYTQATIERMKTTLQKSDAGARGYYTDENGVVYLYRHGEFRRSSEVNSEQVFSLCLFGGVFGLHRLALGKWFTGFLYMLSCGVFLVGWLCDLVQLFFGFQKDKNKRLVRPLENRKAKLSLFPFGLVISAGALFVWIQIFKIVTSSLVILKNISL